MSEHQTRDTTLEAYLKLQDDPIKLGHLQELVFNAIKDNPLKCDKELSEITGLELSCINGRRNELEEMKLIESAGKKKNGNNRNVHLWRVK
jgi:hypothetical protein